MTTDHDPIDELLAGLHADVPEMSDRAFAVGRTHLLLVVDQPTPLVTTADDPLPLAPQGKARALRSPPRRLLPLIASAATVTALAAGVLVARTGSDPATPTAEAGLTAAADKLPADDEPLRPGQYRYLTTHGWHQAGNMTIGDGGMAEDLEVTFLVEERRQLWIPADPTEQCLLRGTSGENFIWLVGDEEKAGELGIETPQRKTFEHRVPCGDFADGWWQQPSTDFLAALPRDPDALYDRLRRDTEGRGADPDLEVLVYVTDALRTGLVPADLRAALYRALAKVPGLEVTEQVANLDGREGTAYGITVDGERTDVIVDPVTGQYLGERRIDLDGRDGIPADTTTSYTAMSPPVTVPTPGTTP
ncbi:CU044_5270 family protein [Actinophytocola sediminis]